MDAKEDIKQRLSVEEVVSDYLELRPAGRNFKALSPFTDEKTPSLMVSPDKQIWHDFSSNKGGDMFSFIMEVESVDFMGALEILARKAGVDLSQYRGQRFKNTNLKERFLEAHKLASKYYHASLSKNTKALEYLKKERRLSPETIRKFRLGFAPQKGTALVDFLVKRGFKTKEIVDAGLATGKWGRPKDIFRGRIVIPLADGQGNVIGFTGRLLDDNIQAPKYLNTPQTLLYDKSRHIFGLHLAKEPIRTSGYAVVVEGNMDVIGSHQAGVDQVVATAGTAMTTYHLRGLQRHTSDIRLCFDSDRAGRAAALRAIDLAQQVGVNLSMITLPEGFKDPDELAQSDVKKWQQAVDNAKYVVDWVIDYYAEQYDLNSVVGKRDYSQQVLLIIARMQDPVEQSHYIKKTSEILGVNERALQKKLNGLVVGSSKKKPIHTKALDAPNEYEMIQDDLLALGAIFGDTRTVVADISVDYFENDDRRALMAYIIEHRDEKGSFSAKDLPIDENYAKIVIFKAEQLYGELTSQSRIEVADKLKSRMLAQYFKKQQRLLTRQIEFAEQEGDLKLTQKLLKDYQQLLKDYKE